MQTIRAGKIDKIFRNAQGARTTHFPATCYISLIVRHALYDDIFLFPFFVTIIRMKTRFEKNVYEFIEMLKGFQHTISYLDQSWDVIFRDQKNKYHHIVIVKSYGIFYLSHVDGNLCTLEIEPHKEVRAAQSFGFNTHYNGSDAPDKAWSPLILSATKWLNYAKKSWVKAAKEVQESYPLNRRKGIVPSSILNSSSLDFYSIDKELGKSKAKKFIRIVEEGYFIGSENSTRQEMTANDYFEYCKIAYIAAKRKGEHIDESMSGRDMYKCYADGRDDGLLEIDPYSKAEFADWIDGKHPKKSSGGHPWEIKRGGNTTHISLYVSRSSYNKETDFSICLAGEAISRLKETISMFLAIHKAGLPITINNPEGIRKRLLNQDNIGIVPRYLSLHRANQSYHEHENVYDVLYFDDLSRYKRRALPFITWEPLPILKPTKW